LKTRIGIFGGTFNPVHTGHLITAQDALEIFDLSKILFVPCNLPPHKDGRHLVSAAHRAAMLEMAIEDNPAFELCDIEIRQGGTNYSVDTVRQIRNTHRDHELFFIIGSDSLLELHQWKDFAELARLCRFVTFIRPGFEVKTGRAWNLQLEPALRRIIVKDVTAVHQISISATDIRHRVAEGMNIHYLVPPSVEMYIAEHNLYKT